MVQPRKQTAAPSPQLQGMQAPQTNQPLMVHLAIGVMQKQQPNQPLMGHWAIGASGELMKGERKAAAARGWRRRASVFPAGGKRIPG